MKKLLVSIIYFLFSFDSLIFAQFPPITPKWVFKPWVWEDSINTKSAVNKMLHKYDSLDIPVGAVILDSPWENPSPVDLGASGDRGYNTFTFEPTRYPNPQNFIDSLNYRGIKTVLWITGIIDSETTVLWNEGKLNHYFIRAADDPYNWAPCTSWWKGSQRASHIDFFNPNAISWWRGLMDRVWDSLEVDGWKIDQSDYRIGELGSLLTYNNDEVSQDDYTEAYYTEIYNYTRDVRGNTGIIFARPYCRQEGDSPRWYAPININTAAWVGDQYHRWDGLNLALENIFISANAGYSVVGSDIGGYLRRRWTSSGWEYFATDKHLFIRWSQFGSTMPLMENGGQSNLQHFPWTFDEETIDIYRYYSNFHEQLIPYFYSYNIKAHQNGTPIIQVIGEGDENNISNWVDDWRYKVGEEIFCAAMYEDGQERIIEFPEKNWIDYWADDSIYYGNTQRELNFSTNQYPIFFRSGSIIPLNVENSITGHGTEYSKNYLTLLMYPDSITTFTLFNDSINSCNIKSDIYTKGCTNIIDFSQGMDSCIIRIKNKMDPEFVQTNTHGNLVKKEYADFLADPNGWYHDETLNYTWVKFSDIVDTTIVTQLLGNLNPSNYEIGYIKENEKYYVDRDYEITSIPEEFNGLKMIKTANNDKVKDSLSLDFRFSLCRDANIYIAYDDRLSPPTWLTSEYYKTDYEILVNDIYINKFDVWTKTASKGEIHLGKNSNTNSSSMYFVFFNPSYIKVYLEGCYNAGEMTTTLTNIVDFPKNQPYYISPWNYPGTESIITTPHNSVDWILVELRDKNNSSTIITTRAGFLLKNGSIIDTNRCNLVDFNVAEDKYYIVIKHRNHLAIMSKFTVPLFKNKIEYDFTLQGSIYGIE